MPIFQYKGYKADGTEAGGTIEADGLKDAALKIKESGIFPKQVNEYIQKERRFIFKRDDAALLSSMTRHLSTLLSSGVPLLDALKSLSEENRGPWRKILTDIRERLSEGLSLSRAMSEHENIFPEFYIHMVSAGETSGNLSAVLSRLSDFLEKQENIRHKVRTAMIYPALMLSIGLIVLSFLFTFVIPKIVKIFEDSKTTLPLITVILINMSAFFKNFWWAIALLIGGCVMAFKRLKEKNALSLDRLILRLPGNIIQSLYFARFTRTFAHLLNGGLPILRALDLSSKSVGNMAFSEKISEAEKKVAEGARLSASLAGFPPTLLQLISTGEKSGMLAEVMNRAANAYEEEFSRRVQKALSLLEPTMILLMGLIVGFIVFAVLLPMFQLNQIVK